MADFYFQLKDLAVGYHGNPLIRDINIGIDKGEIVTLIGPNGSGKSTILKSITRQLKLIGGTVFFDDTSLMELSYKELSSKMAVVLTERIKTELMNCHDIVATGRYPYTGRLGILTKRDEELVEEAMEAVHAQELGNQDFNAISDGQRQRVLLARAICQEPEILILDEPTAGLDPKGRDEILDQIAQLHKVRGITIVLVSHSMEDVAKYAQRLIVVNHGEIAFDDTPKKVFAHFREMEPMGLAAPQITYILHALKEKGLDVDPSDTTVEEAKQDILEALKKINSPLLKGGVKND